MRKELWTLQLRMHNEMCKPTKGCASRTKAFPLLGALQRKHGNILEQGPLGPHHAREPWRRKLVPPWSIAKGPIWLLFWAEKKIAALKVSLWVLVTKLKTYLRKEVGIHTYSFKSLLYLKDDLLHVAFVMHCFQHQITLGPHSLLY